MANPYDDGITLKIKVTPRAIERVILILIILVLAFFVVFGTFCDKNCKEKNITTTGAVVVNETNNEADAAEVVVHTNGNENQTLGQEINDTPTVNETLEINDTTEVNKTVVEKQPDYSGNIDLVIDDVMTQIKAEGAYGKIIGVRFTINNEKEDFMPDVSVYTYEDGDTNSVFVTKPRVERVYSILSLGQKNSYELEVPSQQFVDLSKYIICKVVIKDKATDKVLVTEMQKLKITS